MDQVKAKNKVHQDLIKTKSRPVGVPSCMTIKMSNMQIISMPQIQCKVSVNKTLISEQIKVSFYYHFPFSGLKRVIFFFFLKQNQKVLQWL